MLPLENFKADLPIKLSLARLANVVLFKRLLRLVADPNNAS